MSLDLMLSLAGMLFAGLGALAALVSYVFDSELADVLVPFLFFGLLACQTVRLVCYRETDALAPHGDSGVCHPRRASGSRTAEWRFLTVPTN